MSRIVIAGGPRTGKTTLAERLFEDGCDCGCQEIRHTDDLIHLGWSEASAAAALWFDAPGPWIVEGVAVLRALRKWLAAHHDGAPCDVVYWLGIVGRVPLLSGQAAMGRGCETVWNEIRDALQSRGVEIRSGT